jgi:hypothetical protein
MEIARAACKVRGGYILCIERGAMQFDEVQETTLPAVGWERMAAEKALFIEAQEEALRGGVGKKG